MKFLFIYKLLKGLISDLTKRKLTMQGMMHLAGSLTIIPGTAGGILL